MARNDRISEFWRHPNYHVPGDIGCWNRPRRPKQWPIAQENGQNWPNRQVLTTSQLPCTRDHGLLKSSAEPKTVTHSPRKRPEMTESTISDDFPITMYQGHGCWNRPQIKNSDLVPMKTARKTESTSSNDVTIIVYRESLVFKPSPEPKTVTYSPWKRLEITELTSSDDVPIIVYRGSWVVEIVPRAKNSDP